MYTLFYLYLIVFIIGWGLILKEVMQSVLSILKEHLRIHFPFKRRAAEQIQQITNRFSLFN